MYEKKLENTKQDNFWARQCVSVMMEEMVSGLSEFRYWVIWGLKKLFEIEQDTDKAYVGITLKSLN